MSSTTRWGFRNTQIQPIPQGTSSQLSLTVEAQWGCISRDWLQGGFSHHTRQPNWWSVHQRRLTTSCCPPFWQPPTSYKACVNGWQRQASSFKSSNRLPPKRSRDFCSLANHEAGLESHRAYLGQVRPSYTCSGTSCAKHSSVGSSIVSGMVAAITTEQPTSNWRDET
jgi:hypothetical protein